MVLAGAALLARNGAGVRRWRLDARQVASPKGDRRDLAAVFAARRASPSPALWYDARATLNTPTRRNTGLGGRVQADRWSTRPRMPPFGSWRVASPADVRARYRVADVRQPATHIIPTRRDLGGWPSTGWRLLRRFRPTTRRSPGVILPSALVWHQATPKTPTQRTLERRPPTLDQHNPPAGGARMVAVGA